jgi:kumamolisin
MKTSSLPIPIAGSTRRKLPEAKRIGRANPSKKIRISIYVRQNPALPTTRARITEELSRKLPRERRYLSDEQFAQIFGADEKELKQVQHWAKQKKLKVLDAKAASRRVLVEGTVSNVSAAFSVKLNEYFHPTLGRFRGREGPVCVDPSVHGIVEGVFGLDTRRVGRPRFRRLATTPLTWESAQERRRAQVPKTLPPTMLPGTFYPPEVASLYDYPPQFDATQQNIAVFAFNSRNTLGGYSAAALEAYFTEVLGATTMPSITDVVIHGPGNFPGPDTPASCARGDYTGEVMLDLCVVGSVAPGAGIFVYFSELTTQGWVDAIHAAITDDNSISVISISYGNPEDDPHMGWTTNGVKLVDQALQAAAAKGVTVCVVSGDDGSEDKEPSGAHVDFPASSPWVLAVGGTKLVAKGDSIAEETVWNESRMNQGAGGGGVSVIFSRPEYQAHTNIPPAADPPHRAGRGVPDVAAVADRHTGVVVTQVNGAPAITGGTSVSAPLWASLIARLNQGLNARCGFLNPLLYTKMSQGVLRDITVGSNGAYSAHVGWDACTGFGAPGGKALLEALSGTNTAGAHKR